jgi:hypothetical protein
MSGSREASVQWKPEWVEALRGHLAFGMSASMAAAELNSTFRIAVTRCAVIGKARREDIPLAPAKVGAPKRPRPKRAKVPQRPDIAHRKAGGAPKLVPASFVPRPDPRPGQVPLLDLVPDGCKWPAGGWNGDIHTTILFCNEPQEPGQVYCPAHCGLAYRAPEPRRQRN